MAKRNNLTGKKFGRLTVIGFAEQRGQTKHWNAVCDCGANRCVAAGNLTTGKTQSCGCLHKEIMRARLRDLTGVRFGRLVVTGLAEMRGAWSWWNAICDCGTAKLAKGASLIAGSVRSCGCLARETSAKTAKSRSTHGASYSAEYRIWRGMKSRCYNPNGPKWMLYGGRGIRVCNRWRDSFENFLADVGLRPSAAHSIDRYPNGDGDYEPSNVRWATISEQNSNRRTYTRRRSIDHGIRPAED